jgi:hypothetical protein
MFGFIDAITQMRGVTDDVRAMCTIAVAHQRLFGNAQGSNLMNEALTNVSDNPEFMRGRKAGGENVYKWAAAPKGTMTPALALSSYLRSADGSIG